ncbi:MAG: DUF4956 domain-containing protein [Gemmatimonadaceae bacterium]
MAGRIPRPGLSPATRTVVKVVVYYVLLLGLGSFALRALPHAPGFASYALQPIFGNEPTAPVKRGAASTLDQTTLGLLAFIAMSAGILLSLPVAWVYQLTRAKRGYQQSVVQLLIMLPLVVAGIVVLVKYSVALAFSLAGIVAAVRFRNTLDDSKDAVYVFLATGIGLAAAVDIPVAAVISILFNATMLVLWYSDFGHQPVELEGSIAERRLERAKELARTGTFVARIDDEVFRDMSREQLEGVAERAWRRAHGDLDSAGPKTPDAETRLRVRTTDVARMRHVVDPLLDDYSKDWKASEVTIDGNGVLTIEYVIEPKKSTDPETLLSLVRVACGDDLVEAELR